jgi:replicative DNA helicase
VDSIVRGLKKMQGDHGLVVFVISSFNRQNYLTPVDFESFKESGGIEYTADVVWGLQLQILNEPLFDKDKQIKEKREKVKEAKRADPREIELVCLKNRYGWANYSCNFKYYPRCDLFVEEYNDFDRKDKKPGQGERI